MSLRARILLYVIAVMGIIFVLVVAAILPSTLHDPRAQQAMARDGALTLKAMFESIRRDQLKELLDRKPLLFTEQNVLEGWILSTSDGKVLYWSHPAERQETVGAEATLPRIDYMVSMQTIDGDLLELYVSASRRPVKDGLDWWSIFLVMAVGTALLAFVVYGLILRLVIKPVERMAAASRASSATRGLLLPVASTEREDEIGELVRSYNKMVTEVNDLRRRLEQNVEQKTSELEAAQKQLVLSDRLSMAGRLAAGVAHEVNNPLGGMLNAARSLQARAADGSREREYLDLILDGLARIQHTMSALLQFSRPAQQETSFDVVDVLDGAFMFCRHRCTALKIEVVREIDTAHGRLTVRGHRSELGQVFLNLFVNAIDALESVESGTSPKLTLSVRREAGKIVAAVSDNGAGMTAEVKERVGQFFFSTKSEGKGTGLGLAIAQHIVMQHKGLLVIDSAPGSGTTMRVLLPAEDANSEPAPIAASTESRSL